MVKFSPSIQTAGVRAVTDEINLHRVLIDQSQRDNLHLGIFEGDHPGCDESPIPSTADEMLLRRNVVESRLLMNQVACLIELALIKEVVVATRNGAGCHRGIGS